MNIGQVPKLPRLCSEMGLGNKWQCRRKRSISNTKKTRPRTEPAKFLATLFDGAKWDEELAETSTIQQIFENLNPESDNGQRLIGSDGKVRL